MSIASKYLHRIWRYFFKVVPLVRYRYRRLFFSTTIDTTTTNTDTFKSTASPPLILQQLIEQWNMNVLIFKLYIIYILFVLVYRAASRSHCSVRADRGRSRAVNFLCVLPVYCPAGNALLKWYQLNICTPLPITIRDFSLYSWIVYLSISWVKLIELHLCSQFDILLFHVLWQTNVHRAFNCENNIEIEMIKFEIHEFVQLFCTVYQCIDKK